VTTLTVDRTESARLRATLGEYLVAEVDDGARLVCRMQGSCRDSVGNHALVAGQGSYVGTRYALSDDGRPLRVLIVPKQVGGSLDQDGGRGHEHVTVDGRAAQVDTAKSGARPHPRTNHMIGTALALKILLGMPADAPEAFVLDGETVHVFDCMAMANSTLCSMVGTDASGQGSNVMFRNCMRHLARTIEILRPNVIVAQGWSAGSWSPSKAVATGLGISMSPKNSMTTVETSHGPVALVAAVHPSRNWFTTTMPGWRELEPILHRARMAALPSGTWP
jgi:hypothetical protein